jgi:K+-transporting ATPase ATPase C chain
MLSQLRPAIVVFIILTLITGGAYPLVITGIAQGVFPSQANGSVMTVGGKPVGSALIGQEFTDPKHFWGRPSATGPVPYTAFNADRMTGSSGSNLGPTNPALFEAVKARIAALDAADAAAGYARPAERWVPVDLVTASGSGLDPHISLAAAEYQVPRVAKARGLDEATVRAAVERHTAARQFGVLGEPVVNVLELNLDLDAAR